MKTISVTYKYFYSFIYSFIPLSKYLWSTNRKKIYHVSGAALDPGYKRMKWTDWVLVLMDLTLWIHWRGQQLSMHSNKYYESRNKDVL